MVAGRRGRAQGAVGAAAGARVDGGLRGPPCASRAARSAMREDPVDHRGLGDERDNPHGAMAGRARERVDLKDLLEQRRPPAGGLGGRQPRRGGDHGRRSGRDGLSLTSHPPRAIGIPAVVPRRDVALVGDVHEHPGEELQPVHRLGARRRAFGLVGAIGHGLGGPVVRQPLQRDGIPPPYRASRVANARSSSGTQTAVCTWNPECG